LNAWPRRAWRLGALLPAVAGVAAAVALSAGPLAGARVTLRADLAALAALAGLGLTALSLAGLELRRRWRESLEASRAQAAEDRRRFLRRLDHELKNPLTAIRAGLANLSGEATGSVQEQVLRISRLTADLRKLADLETRPLEREPVDLAEVVEQVVELVRDRPEAATRRIGLSLPRAPWPLPAVPGDRDLLLLVVLNLLENALKFTREGDTIEVRATEDGNFAAVEVADTGPGILPEDLPHIWDELYRGQGARGVPGSGLGLALTRAIVERHGGQVGLRSRAGQGTVFTVRLPIR
jgi:signal transduction histidine kinase